MATPGALGIIPPQNICTTINTWRQKYDPHVEQMEPHVTIAYPPFIKLEEWRDRRATVADCVRKFGPFEVSIAEAGSFPGDVKVLWLKPDDGDILAGIRRSLMSEFAAYVPELPYEYLPHLSVGYFESENALLIARSKVEAELESLSFTVHDVAYVVLGEDRVWRTHENLRLSGT